VRTYAPASHSGSRVLAVQRALCHRAAAAIPFEQVLGGQIERLYTLKQDVVSAGIRSVLGVEMPVNPKRRFQDGAGAASARVTKAWCRNVFNKMWEERLKDTPMHWIGARATRCPHL
jgi:asparagine synthase (glutamine-hydrolysing)